MTEKSAFVVSRDWLKERLHKPGLAIVDASWYLPAAGRNGQEEYEKRIFRARYSSIRIKSPTRSPAFRIPCHRRNSSRSK